jgi:hypothetical protein
MINTFQRMERYTCGRHKTNLGHMWLNTEAILHASRVVCLGVNVEKGKHVFISSVQENIM